MGLGSNQTWNCKKKNGKNLVPNFFPFFFFFLIIRPDRILLQRWIRCECWKGQKIVSPWQQFHSNDIGEILESVYEDCAYGCDPR